MLRTNTKNPSDNLGQNHVSHCDKLAHIYPNKMVKDFQISVTHKARTTLSRT